MAVLRSLLISLAIGSAAAGPVLAGEIGPAPEFGRIAAAVERAESSGGTDPLMWRPQLAGPQGPMQVSAAAAADVGGGDRWNLSENRALGRAYLSELYRRYGNWADALMAYNWGPGSLDLWIKEGRPGDKLLAGVEAYRDRVLRDSGLPGSPGTLSEGAIADPALRRNFLDNSGIIRRLREGLAEPADPNRFAALAMAAIAQAAKRPGFEEFRVLAHLRAKPSLSPELIRGLVSILIAKLQAQNAAILIIARAPHLMPAAKPASRSAGLTPRRRG